MKRILDIGLVKYRGQDTAWQVVNSDFTRALTIARNMSGHQVTVGAVEQFKQALEGANTSVWNYLEKVPRKL